MGYIKEPEGIDFIVGPSELTLADTVSIRQAIASYKRSKAYSKLSSGGGLLTSVSIKASDGKYHAVKVTAEVESGEKKALPYGAVPRRKKGI